MNHRITNFSSFKSFEKAVKKGMHIRVLPPQKNDPKILDGPVTVEGPKMPYIPAFEALCRVENRIIKWAARAGQEA